ncbi:uncharacterized protein G2W53_001672 [Senna tora]|uniref:Uncharacterized protein n=1 Tax=Senna tora TaxID=362788 RepID=A0A834XGQ2_9FABA|nr:uncharacterized protein G2W53_001672 [Senna tora]
MAGNNRQRKSSSSSFFSAFNIFKSKNRGGGYYDAYDDGTRARKVWRSDEDNGHHGGALPDIDMRAEMFIRQYKRRVSEKAKKCYPSDEDFGVLGVVADPKIDEKTETFLKAFRAWYKYEREHPE